MAEGDHPDEHWSYPHCQSIVHRIRDHIKESAGDEKRFSKAPGNNAHQYVLEDGFLPKDCSWMPFMRDECMTHDSKVLYRPKIVKKIVDEIDYILAKGCTRGLLVKGPQGVGKSYSLINLTRFLMASDQYWVTIFPNCQHWTSKEYFFRVLLQSVGVDLRTVRRLLEHVPSGPEQMMALIDDIDEVLLQHGMKWVFIFDQINRIFARSQFHDTKDVSMLPFPYSMMLDVLKGGRIISIISASGNNDVSHRENHDGYEVFQHPPQFDDDEIKLLYTTEEMAGWNLQELEYATGRVPLYINRWANNPSDYAGQVSGEIREALILLEEETRTLGEKCWKALVQSAIYCLLCLSSSEEPKFLDRKYTRVTKDLTTEMYSIAALFPLVVEEYRDFFWDYLATYIDENEGCILNVCATATQNVQGCLFEQLVIRRLVKLKLSAADVKTILTDAGLAIEVTSTLKAAKNFMVTRVPGWARYPQLWNGEGNCTYFVPMAPKFPAADLIIHVGKIVIAVQITISPTHGNMLTLLQEKASAAGWDEECVEKIILLYLCPTKDIANQLEEKIGEQAGSPTRSLKRHRVTANDRYISLFYSIDDLACLKNLQWRH